MNLRPLNRRSLLAGAAMLATTPLTARAATFDSSPLEAEVSRWAAEEAFQGVAAKGEGGRILTFSSAGLANTERNTGFDADTQMGVASISKRLTAVAVMRLVERNRLSLDQPISAYLPTYRADTGARVTLRRLLSNSSGVPNQFTPALRADPGLLQQPMTTLQAVNRFAAGDLAFEPGARFDYALTNWIIVMAVLETVVGQAYPDIIDDLVIRPLGLTSTGLTISDASAAYRAPRPYLAASGGFYSTARDLVRFDHLVHDTDFLKPESRRALTTVEVPDAGYALGGRVRSVTIDGQVVDCAWDTGNRDGYRAVLGHRLDGRGSVVVLNNTGLSQRTMDVFAERLLNLKA